MKASEYQGLTKGLDKLTEWSDTLRAVFSKAIITIPEKDREPGGPSTKWATTDEARNNEWYKQRYDILRANMNWAGEITGKMDSLLDEFVDDNQARADRGLAITDPCRALFNAMSRFLDATDAPINGAARLYDDVRIRCQDWRGRLITWFPNIGTTTGIDMKPAMTTATGNAFVDRLKSSDAYNKAIEDGTITAPSTWNGTIKDLADWLLNNDLILDHSRGVSPTRKWCWADSIFKLPNGSVVTRERLKNAFHH